MWWKVKLIKVLMCLCPCVHTEFQYFKAVKLMSIYFVQSSISVLCLTTFSLFIQYVFFNWQGNTIKISNLYTTPNILHLLRTTNDLNIRKKKLIIFRIPGREMRIAFSNFFKRNLIVKIIHYFRVMIKC